MSDTYRVILDDCKILENDLRKKLDTTDADSIESSRLKDALAYLVEVGAWVDAAMLAAKKEAKE